MDKQDIHDDCRFDILRIMSIHVHSFCSKTRANVFRTMVPERWFLTKPATLCASIHSLLR